jgi:tetratricopeptide (TPR) repeat protein
MSRAGPTHETGSPQALAAQALKAVSDAHAWLKAGKALALAGDGEGADQAFERYFALTPGRKSVAEGAECHRRGDFSGALAAYQQALGADPGNVDALRLSALAHSALGHGQEAERAARQAVRLAPEFSRAWNDLGAVLQELDRAEDAVEAFARAARLRPADPAAHAHLANALFVHGDLPRAEASYRTALSLQPGEPASSLGLGHVLKTIGRFDHAVAAYKACLAARPHSGQAWWSLANLKTYRFSRDDEAAMGALLNEEAVSGAARVNVAYALGKAREDAEAYDEAFAHYGQGAALQRTLVRYDPVQTEAVNERIKSVFSRDFLSARAGHGAPDPAPIFIVGLPRSGSTLIEQILASHSQVDGTSELPILGRVTQEIGRFRSDGVVYPEAARDLEAHDLKALGQAYLERAARHRGARPYFTDKMPNNFASVGLIALILPNAKIIDARRHPMDACWGAFKQLFARGQTYTYDLFELGHFYLEYDALMRHWDDVLPGRVLRIDYEAMVCDQENQTRLLLAHCGLPFEAQCLRFHETVRAVNTASSEQVRRPLYKSGLGAWRRFGAHLTALEAQLRPVLDALPPHVRDAGG